MGTPVTDVSGFTVCTGVQILGGACPDAGSQWVQSALLVSNGDLQHYYRVTIKKLIVYWDANRTKRVVGEYTLQTGFFARNSGITTKTVYDWAANGGS
jgi:hypothetical protein